VNGIISNEVKRKLNLFKELSFSDFQNGKVEKGSSVGKITKSNVQENIKRMKKGHLRRRERRKKKWKHYR
jgi:hypothetical protein